MTTDYIALGSLPLSEHYPLDRKFREKYHNKICLAYLNQLRRLFPEQKNNLSLRLRDIKALGGYSVTIDFEDQEGFNTAMQIAEQLPYCWDESAQKELGTEYFKELRNLLSSSETNTPPQEI